MSTPKVRVLVVDDSFFMRKIISDFLKSDPAIEVVGEASDGKAALQRITELHPEVVTLDIEMPIMDGVKTLETIVDLSQPPSVIMVSGYARIGADVTLHCLAIGAVDFILKPSGSFSLDMDKIKDSLIEKVKNAAIVDITKVLAAPPPALKDWNYHKSGGIVVIGASTGGPAALDTLLSAFPKNFPYPIVVAQHLPKEFTASFTSRLKKRCRLHVVCAEQSMSISPGTVYIAPGGSVTTIYQASTQPTLNVQIDTKSLETPSINLLMKSAAALYEQQTIGIILTGMGQDGAEGMARIKQVGGHTIVQDESTSAVFGMGSEAIIRGVADSVVPLGEIIEKTSELLV